MRGKILKEIDLIRGNRKNKEDSKVQKANEKWLSKPPITKKNKETHPWVRKHIGNMNKKDVNNYDCL